MNLSPRAIAIATVALILGGVGIGTTEFVSMGLLPQIAETLQVSIPRAGWLISAYALGVVVGAPVLSVFCARYPRKELLLGLVALFIVGNSASALASSFPLMLIARFAAGFPHGAFFGVGALVAASLVEPGRRGRQIGRMMFGIPIANLLGVPATTWLGQYAGWRAAYWTVALIGVATAVMIALFIPHSPGDHTATGRRELAALKDPKLLLSLGAGAFGFGGLFAMYAYIAPTVTEVAGRPISTVPIYLFLFGLGGLIGSEIAGRLSEWSVSGSVAVGFASMGVTLLLFSWCAQWFWVGLALFGISSITSSILVVNLQMQMMADAGRAETMGAALNHSALNMANALGAWLGGLVIAAGWGYRMPSLVGAAVTCVGLLFLAAHRVVGRRTVTR